MIEILCTLGPSSMNDRVIGRLNDLGVALLRINLSHTAITDLGGAIDYIRERTNVPICIDTEGAQVRTGQFSGTTAHLCENSFVEISGAFVIGSTYQFNLYPRDVVNMLEIGDFLSIDFNSVLVQVVERGKNSATIRVISGGLVGSSKAVTINRDIRLPPLTEKDQHAIKIGRERGIQHFALSFADSKSDVQLIRNLAGNESIIISKIESRGGLARLDEICNASDALLVDRGDLSREVPLEKIPVAQKVIISKARKLGKKAYVATNLLESMVSSSVPTRAEVNDIYNTLLDGASGLVLAAETAIGRYPVECVRMIASLISEFSINQRKDALYNFSVALRSQLVEPHGGTLVQSLADKKDSDGINQWQTITVDDDILSDCKLIATGVYSPLVGFMDESTLETVLEHHKLPNGLVWPMPVVLIVTEEVARSVTAGERIVLASVQGDTYAIMDLTSVFRIDVNDVAKAWFGTSSRDHPGVKRFSTLGDWLLAGPIQLLRSFRQENSPYELTPEQCRFVFAQKGWEHVVGFHTRNVVHRAHEFIQLKALEDTRADGLFINPALGSKKSGDFLSDPIIKSYQLLLETGVYPPGRVVLGSLSTYSRYSGPREAIFTALCRKNMGCDYFIVGRDHTGVGNYYDKTAVPELFETVGDIGITPVYFDTVGFNQKTGKYSMESSKSLETISASQFRDSLVKHQRVDDWFVRSSIQEMLIAEMDAGRKLFHE